MFLRDVISDELVNVNDCRSIRVQSYGGKGLWNLECKSYEDIIYTIVDGSSHEDCLRVFEELVSALDENKLFFNTSTLVKLNNDK